jgi:pSer/pThr/pTyr-binding forkhead associated (FHA) protein
MLKLRYLNGNSAGQYLTLKSGDNFIGRLQECDICIQSPGISKKHAKIILQGDKCVIKDLGSSNGTFVNGVKISERILRIGDKIAFHNVMLELAIGKPWAQSPGNTNLAYQQQPSFQQNAQIQATAAPKTLTDALSAYAQNVILPGVYKLIELYPLRNVMAVFLLGYILLVTLLSTIPMVEMTKTGIQKEAQRRALTIAKQLATITERAIATGTEANIRTDFAEAEDGVTLAVVVAKEDGHIIAPLSKAQSYSNEEFVARGRKHDETFVQQINDTTVGVSVPIRTFNQEAGQQVITAYAEVLYKLDSFQWSESIGLLARVLIMALLLGSIVYLLLYRTLVQPIEDATRQLDEALRGERDTIKSKYDFEVFNKFIENVNGALGRMSQQSASAQITIDRSSEASNLVRIISDPAFALDGNGLFLQINSAFEDLTGMRLLSLQGLNLEALQDQALKLNLEDLIQRAMQQPGSIVTSQLDISGLNHEIDIQASREGENIGYYIGTLKRKESS